MKFWIKYQATVKEIKMSRDQYIIFYTESSNIFQNL